MIGSRTINPNKKWQNSGGRKQEVTLALTRCHKVKSSGPWEVFAEGYPACMNGHISLSVDAPTLCSNLLPL